MSALEKISRCINRWVEYLLFGLGLSMAAIVVVQVFFRYVINQSLFWSEELARFLLVWLTFLGASVAYHRRAHPGIDILHAGMPPPIRKLFTLAVHGASISLFVVMIYYGCQFAYFVRMQISPALNLPKWTVMSIIPVSGTILLFHGMTFLLGELFGSNRDH